MTRTAVLFDIDGTLLDSTYLHTLAWRRAFVECGHSIPTARVHRRIGMGSSMLLRDLLGDERSELAQAAREAHRVHFDKLKPEIAPFDQARELLAAVGRRGPRVVLATSADAHELPAMLAALGDPDEVDVVTSGDDVEHAKPDPEVFRVAMHRARVEPGAALVIGDTVWDIAAARAAGIGCVSVLTGGISRGELLAAGALAVYRDVGELLAGLDGSPLNVLWP